MLTNKDLNEIRNIVQSEVKAGVKAELKESFQLEFKSAFRSGIMQFWDQILKPQFNLIHERTDKLESKVNSLPTMEYVDGKINQLPTKEYIDDKFSDFKKELHIPLRPKAH